MQQLLSLNKFKITIIQQLLNGNSGWEFLTYVISKSSESVSFGRTSPKTLWNMIVWTMPASVVRHLVRRKIKRRSTRHWIQILWPENSDFRKCTSVIKLNVHHWVHYFFFNDFENRWDTLVTSFENKYWLYIKCI